MAEVTCPICGEAFENRMKLGSHMWTKHKVKLKEYEAGKTASVNESAKPKAAEALFEPAKLTEAKKNDILEAAVKVDRDFVRESTVSDGEFVKQKVEISNPYKDLFPPEGTVINECLG